MPAKKEAIPVKKVVEKKTKVEQTVAVSKPKVSPKTSEFSVPVYSLIGKTTTTLSLPKTIFGVKVNKNLLAQAIRVYQTNAQAHHGHTKTRGEVQGSTRKIYAQKGTGRARHGSIMAPIFVGGGVAMGPRARKVTLDLPKKMKKAALISALSQKLIDQQILGLSGFDKSTGKTKEMSKLVLSIKNQVSSESQKKVLRINALMVVGSKMENAQRAVKNIPGLDFMTADQLNVFEIIKHKSLLLTQEAVSKLEEKLLKKENN